VLLSGRGSNFEALAAACDAGLVPARIVTVVSDVAGAAGLERARGRGLRSAVVARSTFADRSSFESALDAELRDSGAQVVCLAGFMRLLSPRFCAEWEYRLVNIHPSLLPAFPGLAPQRQALEWGARVSGATVHLVDAGLDSGPIVGQEAVPILDGDDAAALSARILAVEHRLYAGCLARLLHGGWSVLGRRLVFDAQNPSFEGL